MSKDLDEDDYLLLQDNNVKIQKRKYKRLKKAQREREIGQLGSSDDEFDGSGGAGRSAEDNIKDWLFDDVDADDVGDEEKIAVEEDVVGSEDEMADFIVDEDGFGPPKRENSKKKITSAMRDAKQIFGDHVKFKKILASSSESDLYEKYTVEKDKEICQLDVPERMQVSLESTPPGDEISSIEEESNWIHASFEGQGFSVNKVDIANFLELHRVQKLEIPFIAMYRKEQCHSLLNTANVDDVNLGKKPETKWHKIFWMIYDLDKKWLLIRKRKTQLDGYYSKCFEKVSREDNQHFFESIIQSLKAAETEREVDDVSLKFDLHFPPGEVGVDEGQYKRPKRVKSQYSVYSKAGLWEVAKKFGYSAEQLGLALSLEKLVDKLEDAKETPEEMALNFVCTMFENPQDVLKGARHMAAVDISCEPSVKKYVRGIYMENAVISTSPTVEGEVVINSFHQFDGVKWLREKPLSKFEGAQWLLIQKAAEEKLLQVTFKLPMNYMNRLISGCNEHYLSVGVSKYAQLWNEQRKLILEDALHAFLLPSMEKEARSFLTSRAKSRLLSEYGQALWNKVSAGPYQKKEMDISSDKEAAPRVMACCWGHGRKPQISFVMLGSSGELLDVLYAGSLTLRSQNVNEEQCKKSDHDRVLEFITNHQPHILALAAVNLSCTFLKDDFYKVIQMVKEKPRDVGQGISIVYVDESLPRLYENSRMSGEQLPQQSGIVKRAVGIGRYIQNPLAMVATLCGPDREVLSWKLHPLDNFLQADEKYGMVEQVMVDITNQVGIDISLALSHKWLFSPLQFISGLGPMKAANLQSRLVTAGSIFSRNDLLIMHGLGEKVYQNVAGFLRSSRLAASSNQFICLLERSRIHPESYGLAQELAKYVKHLRDGCLGKPKPVPHKKWENKKETIRDILREYSFGFQDWRIPFKDPTPEEEIYMLWGETLAEGTIVQASVSRLLDTEAKCVLDSGLSGTLMKEDFADDQKRLKEGNILTCKIKSIEKERHHVYLSCKESAMRNNRHQQNQNMDPYYHEVKTRKQKKVARNTLIDRICHYELFKNITAKEAIEHLSDKNVGAWVVRPSYRGIHHLNLTLKIYDGVYAHKEILEGGKGNNLLSIGKTLKIGEDTFDELDEVMARYVEPLMCHLKTMVNYRKFRKGTKSEVDDLLRIEKGENQNKMLVYSFGISHENPGNFILTYIRSINLYHESIGLYPKGFKFRNIMFEGIDSLVEYIQPHIMHEAASGGSRWGGSQNEGGWKGNSNRSSGSGSRGGRGGEYRNGGRRGGGGHPSRAPRPYGGRGRGRGSGRRDDMNSDRQDGNGDWGSESGGGKKSCWGSESGRGSSGGWGSESGGKKSGGGIVSGGWRLGKRIRCTKSDGDGGLGDESSGRRVNY